MLVLVAACAPQQAKQNAETRDTFHVVEIEMIAKQFDFVPGTSEPIRVKQGDTVRIRATSVDVPHGIAIPDYDIKVGLPVGEEKLIEFVADKPGTFTFYCSVYCGDGHGRMKGTLIVES